MGYAEHEAVIKNTEPRKWLNFFEKLNYRTFVSYFKMY
jgi:hypothetical protein